MTIFYFFKKNKIGEITMQINKKGQALSVLQSTVLGVVSTVAILGVGYAVIQGLLDSQAPGGVNENSSQAAFALNGGFDLLDIVKNNLGIIITIAVFVVVLAGIAAFAVASRQ